MYQHREKVKHNNKINKAILTALVGFVAIVMLLPIVLTITNSFMSTGEILKHYGSVFASMPFAEKSYISKNVPLHFIPEMVSLEQYQTVLLKSPEYLFKFWNSVFLVVPIVIFQLTVASLAAYGFARYPTKIKELIFLGYIILLLLPYQVTLLPNFLVADSLRLINTRWVIWLSGIFSPFAVFLLTKYMKRIPRAYLDAARVDGAGEWTIFLKICLPLCKETIYTSAILIFINYWNMVELPLILMPEERLHPLSIFLSRINAEEMGIAFAAATIYMIPCILLFLYGEGYLVQQITFQGEVKE